MCEKVCIVNLNEIRHHPALMLRNGSVLGRWIFAAGNRTEINEPGDLPKLVGRPKVGINHRFVLLLSRNITRSSTDYHFAPFKVCDEEKLQSSTVTPTDSESRSLYSSLIQDDLREYGQSTTNPIIPKAGRWDICYIDLGTVTWDRMCSCYKPD